MYNYGYSSYGSSSSGEGVLVFAGIVALALIVVMLVAWAKVFKKAGEKGWKILIPIYGSYVTYKIAGCTNLFWASLACSLITAIVGVPVVATIVGIVSLVISILFSIRLAEAFGKGGGFAVGLIFLMPIFVMILGFGSAKYRLGGAPSVYSPSPAAESTWVCPRCNKENPASQTYCQDCSQPRW